MNREVVIRQETSADTDAIIQVTMKTFKTLSVGILLLVVMLHAGCGLTAPPQILETKPFEKIIEERYKRLQNSRELTLETIISSKIVITRANPYYSVKYLKANLKLVPITDNRQRILNLEIKAPGKLVGNSLEFTLDDPSPGFHEFRVKTETVCRYEHVRVTDKISWPFQIKEAEHIKYTEPSAIIDSDDKNIRTHASSIAEGEDDLYRVVFKAGKWVMDNVHSVFDTTTVYTSQKASWVLENQEGVCDEKTNLFIGFLRSLGIPAKFITGFVGINYNYRIIFKPHSWAEVYFPSVGWIPFDVAYNQLGFIDATHIKISESVDTSDALTSYEWKSIDISDYPATDGWDPGKDLVSIKKLKIGTKVTQETGTVAPLLKVAPKVWHINVDAESYNVIEATVSNPNNFYVITDLSLQLPSESRIMGENRKVLLLNPNAGITVYWIIKSTFDLGKNMTATFPINIVGQNSSPASVEFHISKEKGYPEYSFERLEKQVKRKLEMNTERKTDE